MKKLLLFALVVQVFVCVVVIHTWNAYVKKKINYSMYIFENPVPNFNPSEDSLIRESLPHITSAFPNFYRFYVESIKIKDGFFIISLRTLGALQDGGDKNRTMGKDTAGGKVVLIFDSNLNFIKKETYF